MWDEDKCLHYPTHSDSFLLNETQTKSSCFCLFTAFDMKHHSPARLVILNVVCAVYWHHIKLPMHTVALYSTAMGQRHPSFMRHSSKCWSDNFAFSIAKKFNNFSGFTFYSPVALQGVPSFETLSVEMESLKRHLSQIDSPTVLCHNDLLTKNIIYNNKEGEERLCTSLTPEKTWWIVKTEIS